MDGRSPGGNPSAAPSHSFPAHTRQEMHERTDRISAAATSEVDDLQKRENVVLSSSSQQTDVSPVETEQAAEEPNHTPAIDYGSYQDLQLPDQRKPADPPQTEQQKPGDLLLTEQQKPADPPQTEQQKPGGLLPTEQQKPGGLLLTEQQKPADPLLTEQQKPGDPPQTEQQKPGGLLPTEQQKPGGLLLTEQQKPADPPQTEQQKPGGLLLTEQQKPADPPQTEQQKPGLLPTEQQKPGDLLLTEQQKPADLLLTEQQKPGDPLLTEQQKPGDPLLTEQQKPGDLLPTEQQKPGDLLTEQQKPGDLLLTEQQKPGDLLLTEQQKPADPPQTEQQKPGGLLPTEQQKPGGLLPTEQQKPGDPPQTEQQKPGGLLPTEQQKPGGLLLTEQQKPADPPQTEQQKPGGLLLTEQQKPADPPQTEQQKPGGLLPTEQQKPGDPLLTEQQKPGDLLTEQQKPGDLLPTEQQKPGDLLPTEQQKPGDLLTEQQKPGDLLLTEQQKPEDSLLTEQQKPGDPLQTEQQKPGDPPQTEQQKPGDPPQTEQQKPGDPPQTERQKPGDLLLTERQKPGDPPRTEQQKPGDLLLTEQQKPGDPPQTERQKPGDLLLTEQQKPGDPPQTEQQKPGDLLLTEQQKPGDPPQTEQQKPGDLLPTEQQKPEDPPQTEQQKPGDPPQTEQQKPGDLPPIEQQKPGNLLLTEQQKPELPLVDERQPEDPFLAVERKSEDSHLTRQQNSENSLSTDQQKEKVLPQKHQEHAEESPPTHQESPKVPPLKDHHKPQSSPQTDEQNPAGSLSKDQLKLKHLSPTDQWEQKTPPLKDQLKPEDPSPTEQQREDLFLSKWKKQKDRSHPATKGLNVLMSVFSEQKDPDLHLSEAKKLPNNFDPKDPLLTDKPAASTLNDQSDPDPCLLDHKRRENPSTLDLKAQQAFPLEGQDQKVPPPVEPQNCKQPPKEHSGPPLEQRSLQNCPPKDQKVCPSADKQKSANSPTTSPMPHPAPPCSAKQENHQNLPKTEKSSTAPEQQTLRCPSPEKHHPPSSSGQNAKCPVQAPSQETPPPPTDLNTQQTPPADPFTLPSPADSHLDKPSMFAPPLISEASCEQVQAWPNPVLTSSGEPKLCGFLQKQGGPLKAWKQRWFTYEEQKNQLLYYRTPQNVTPLGRVELGRAIFTYPLKAERGTFHIKTPERTFILKAVTQDVMLYWLQQLQLKRWQHRQTTCSDPTNANSTATDEFLPLLTSPMGLVGEDAANVSSQRTLLANMSIKHPIIEIQNSVHSLRKRSSQEWSQSVFHVEAPPWIPPNATDADPTTTTPATPPELQTPPSPLPLADSAETPSPCESQRRRKTKNRSSASMPTLLRETLSPDRTSRLQQEKQMLLEEIKAQKELVWLLHKTLEASQLEKRTCAEFLAATCEQDRLEVLRHRERQAVDLRGRLEETRAESEATKRSLAQRDAQVAELQDDIRMLTEKNRAKQEVILKMAEQVSACVTDPRLSSSSSGRLDAQTFRQLQQENENLKDDIEAYKTQNKFLNSELYQLTKLWRKSSEQEKSLMVKCADLEARNCRLESRYLGVLRKLQENKSLDPVQQEAVQKLIEDALRGEVKNAIKLNPARDHDDYGFKIIPDYEVEDMKLLAKIQALEIRSYNLLHQDPGERPLLSRWAQFLARRSDDDLCPSPELKGLLRAGIPHEYRQRVWCWVVETRTRSIRARHPQRYQQLCDKSRMCPHPASRQIQLDLHRTLTTNKHFCSPSSPALQQLQRILLAFSWQNPTIGYCQGLNRLAAIALLILQSEEDAFWCLVSVVEIIMPQDYYTKNLVASQADQRVLKEFMAEKLPKLVAHFDEYNIDVSLITFNWFLVVFVESLPSDILLPLWDAFLYEGTKVIFRYTLAIFKYKEDDILKIHDSVEIYQYLRFFTKTISDSRRLTTIAFCDMNPFPGRLLKNRRAVHLERLQGELRELEEQQKEFVTECVERKDKELDTMVSEDDDEL